MQELELTSSPEVGEPSSKVEQAIRVQPHFSLRWQSIIEWALLALLIGYAGVRAYPRAWQTLESDFPNYYLTARLTREHYDTSRIYEWQWLQRQRDHHGIDQRLVGMVPITPFSTLLVWPVASLPPLQAKHVWLVFNFFLLLASITVLQRLTQLPWRHIALIAAISIPLRSNFILGQYYVVLLLLLSLACLLYLRQWRFLSGLLIGIAAALKIFPIIYLFYFLRKKDWRATFGVAVSGSAIIVLSLLIFGWELHRTFLFQVLPPVLRGEGLAPYNLVAASLPSLLHSLFIFEPQLNPHPALNAPWLFALFHPLLQMLLLAPALLLARPAEAGPDRLQMEWSAILLVSLALSTSPGSYLFTLLILPVCLIAAYLYKQRLYKSLVLLLCLYAGVGVARAPQHFHEGWLALPGVPRLYLLILLCLFAFMLLSNRFAKVATRNDRSWQLALAIILLFNITTNLRHQRGLYSNSPWRLPTPARAHMVDHAVVQPDSLAYISMAGDGYHFTEESHDAVDFRPASNNDQLGVSAAPGGFWVEEAGLESSIRSTKDETILIPQAESPATSMDGRHLAFLRDDHGRSRLWIHSFSANTTADAPLTPPDFNILEAAFLTKDGIIFSADFNGRPALYTVDMIGNVNPLGVDQARYPAASPDGGWLVYSQLSGGSWNLWLRDQHNGESRRLTSAACNDIEPAWTPDSHSIVYASDCGRGLWFTALYKRRVVP